MKSYNLKMSASKMKVRDKLECGIFLVLITLSFAENQAFAQTESGDSSLVVAKGISQDGTVIVTIISTPVEIHKPLVLQISFTNAKGHKIAHENYGIRAMHQESNGITILSNQTAYAENGDDLQVTLPLDNPSPVNFQIQLQGSGLPGTDPSTWKGQIDTVGITVVPEFGSLVSVILISSLIIAIFFVRRFGTRFSYFGKYAG
jgi:predicted secreted protein with PEFG-CTERM motif